MFYTFEQNDAGGDFLGGYESVVIEADTAEEANERAERLGLYFNGVNKGIDCECCGDRWTRAEGKGREKPLVLGRTYIIHLKG